MGTDLSWSGRVERPYSYYHRDGAGGWWCSATKEEWLEAIIRNLSSPKPPRWWINQQALEGRSEKQAAIIWGRHYPPERKFLIWSQASDDDFREHSYL